MQQEFKLGVEFRKRYIESYHLLPLNYVAETMYVRSSDFDRTLMSAASVLLGLYPLGTGPHLTGELNPALPAGYQPIPIHSVPLAQETLLVPDSNPEKFKALLNKYVFTRKDWQAKNAELQPKFAAWSKKIGLPIDGLYSLYGIGDTLYVYQQHHIALPAELTEEDVQEIIGASRFIAATVFDSDAVGSAVAHDLLTKIGTYFQQISQQQTPLKFVLFSAHDSTILGVMSALQAPFQGEPPYASDLNFLLFDNGHGNYSVKVSLNNEFVSIPRCGGTVCSLSQFMKLIE
jgi:lysosomal acid phosphatase